MNLRKTAANYITKPLVPVLNKWGLNPNILTWFGLIINIIVVAVIATGHLLIGGLLFLFAGLLDILDGSLARFSNKTTLFGAVLDSTFDRISEALLLFGLLILNLKTGNSLEISLLIFGTLVGSFLVSYVRARAEGLGIDCQVGLLTRAERVILLTLGLVFNQVPIALIILIILSFYTLGQRLVYVHNQTKNRKIFEKEEVKHE